MSPGFNAEETAHSSAYNYTMLKVLIIEFLRETKVSFSVIGDPKWRAIFEFIKPGIVMPTITELIELNIEHYNTFGKLESKHQECAEVMSVQRGELVKQCMKVMEVVFPNKRQIRIESQSNGIYMDHIEDPTTSNHHQNGLINAQYEPIVEVGEEVKLEQLISDYDGELIEMKPTFDELQMIMIQQQQPSFSNSNSPYDSQQQANGGVYRDDHNDNDNGEKEEIKPEINALIDPSLFNGSSIEQPMMIPYEDIPTSSSIPTEYIPKIKKQRNRGGDKLLKFEGIPGYSNWPCIVCNQRVETSRVRSVTNSDAYIMLYVCVQQGNYSLETAKDLSRMATFKCCIAHFSEMHDNALHFLNVVDPRIDIHTDNDKIVDAYHIVKSIKDSRFQQKLVFEGSRKYMVPFCNQLKKFFEKYSRQNYVPTPKALMPIETSKSPIEEEEDWELSPEEPIE